MTEEEAAAFESFVDWVLVSFAASSCCAFYTRKLFAGKLPRYVRADVIENNDRIDICFS